MGDGPHSGKQTICGSCRQRTCCYHYRVALTGADLWQIARTLELQPTQFATYVSADEDSEATLVLDRTGQRFELVLARTSDPRRFGGCVFLVATNSGAHRCGLGDLRPDQCHLYPVFVHEGLVRLVDDPQGCWRTWSLAEIELDRERERSAQHEHRQRQYRDVLADWNRRVWGGGRDYTFAEFCDYLENRYGAFDVAAE